VDRAALDAAIDLGIEHGGWCPAGRRSEDGRIADRYRLQEAETGDYAERTKLNVVDSDGTLILYRERLQGGTLLTHRLAKEIGKPLLRVRLDRPVDYARIVDWLRTHEVKILNVAGPRGSSHPELESRAKAALLKLFSSTAELPLDGLQ
jgi:hypothetical protein